MKILAILALVLMNFCSLAETATSSVSSFNGVETLKLIKKYQGEEKTKFYKATKYFSEEERKMFALRFNKLKVSICPSYIEGNTSLTNISREPDYCTNNFAFYFEELMAWSIIYKKFIPIRWDKEGKWLDIWCWEKGHYIHTGKEIRDSYIEVVMGCKVVKE